MWRLRNRCYSISKTLHQLHFASNASSKYDSISFPRNEKNEDETLGSGARRLFSSQISSPASIHRNDFITIESYYEAPILRGSLTEERKFLKLQFEGINDTLVYPVIWLRDNCQCPNCFDKISQSRISDQLSLRRELYPAAISTTDNSVRVTWNDGHVSDFSKEWLCDRSFREMHWRERIAKRVVKRETWTSETFRESERFRKFTFHEIVNEDHFLLQWLKQLAVLGVAVITETPNEDGQLRKLAERIAFIRKTHYGEEFEVKGSEDAYNVAYKKGALQLHTDLPYYNYMPGIVMLQCIQPSLQGGDNILCDGFNVASQLPRDVHRILATTVMDWVDIGVHGGKRFYSLNREPVLCLNYCGDLEKINWSQPQRDSVFNGSPLEAAEWYDAALEFTRLIHMERNAVTFKSKPGDILTFDNRRILHGRTDYTDAHRLLYGAYVDWDEIYSRIRILQDELRSTDS